jgi:hypothetical protein
MDVHDLEIQTRCNVEVLSLSLSASYGRRGDDEIGDASPKQLITREALHSRLSSHLLRAMRSDTI